MITKDAQVKGLFKNMSEGKPLYVSAQRADICENTARKYVKSQRFPSDLKQPHTWAYPFRCFLRCVASDRSDTYR